MYSILSNWQFTENKKDPIATGIAPFMQQNLHVTQILSRQRQDRCDKRRGFCMAASNHMTSTKYWSGPLNDPAQKSVFEWRWGIFSQ